MSGLVHIYCGDGKGKTTAAMGLAVRCAGWQKRVLVAQLMKQDNSGERRILEQLPQVTLWQTYPSAKFSFRMTDAEKQAAAEWYTAQFRKIAETVQHGAYAMLVLDELLSCITCGFLLERADYVTEMTLRKHPYEKGISARKGIEY